MARMTARCTAVVLFPLQMLHALTFAAGKLVGSALQQVIDLANPVERVGFLC